jgi:general nucleoside transport system permease protein
MYLGARLIVIVTGNFSMHKSLETWFITLFALCCASIFIALFILSTGNSPGEIFYSIYRGAFGSWFSWQNTLVRAAPLMLTALCTALPARVGLIVIGGEGAVVLGGLSAAVIGISLNGLPPLLVITAMILGAGIMGGFWIGLAGALRHYRNVNETISSLLLNYIAIALLNFFVVGALKDPATLNNPSTHAIGETNMLGSMGESSIHWGLLYGLLICVIIWILTHKSTFGFSINIVGGNVRAAKLAGLSVGKVILITCFIGGAAAGIAGMIEVAAIHGRANSALNAGYGYAGILVAFLARHNPLAIIPFAILLGGIQASGGLLQRAHDLPDATVNVIQGIIFMVILTSEIFYGKISWFRPKKI